MLINLNTTLHTVRYQQEKQALVCHNITHVTDGHEVTTGQNKNLSDMKYTVMITRSWVRTLVRSTLGCIVLLSKLSLNQIQHNNSNIICDFPRIRDTHTSSKIFHFSSIASHNISNSQHGWKNVRIQISVACMMVKMSYFTSILTMSATRA